MKKSETFSRLDLSCKVWFYLQVKTRKKSCILKSRGQGAWGDGQEWNALISAFFFTGYWILDSGKCGLRWLVLLLPVACRQPPVTSCWILARVV